MCSLNLRHSTPWYAMLRHSTPCYATLRHSVPYCSDLICDVLPHQLSTMIDWASRGISLQRPFSISYMCSLNLPMLPFTRHPPHATLSRVLYLIWQVLPNPMSTMIDCPPPWGEGAPGRSLVSDGVAPPPSSRNFTHLILRCETSKKERIRMIHKLWFLICITTEYRQFQYDHLWCTRLF